MSQTRVFVVDDSVVYRKILIDAINSIPNVRTIGVAENGEEAIEIIPKVKPDLITLDLNMPVMDGLETLKKLHHCYPDFRAIIVSTYTEEGASATIESLEAGALDYITKPNSNDYAHNNRLLKKQLEDIFVKFSYFKKDFYNTGAATRQKQQFTPSRIQQRNLLYPVQPQVVAIAISTGGPNALSKLLPLFPQTYPLPILIVQHMPKLFTNTLAQSLDKTCKLSVVEAQEGMILKAGTVYLAPGGFQMKVQQRKQTNEVEIKITDDPPENHCKPSADYLFRSVAKVYRQEAVGVIMTGMGSDGILGLRLMKRHGANVIAQNKATCIIYGMPREAVEAGIVDLELPLTEIAHELIRATER